MDTGTRHIDRYKTEVCLVTSGTGTGTSLWLDMALYSHVTFFIQTSNSSGTPALTYTFYQALTTGGSSSKGRLINNYFYCSNGFGTQSSSADSWQQSSSGITGGSFAAISTGIEAVRLCGRNPGHRPGPGQQLYLRPGRSNGCQLDHAGNHRAIASQVRRQFRGPADCADLISLFCNLGDIATC